MVVIATKSLLPAAPHIISHVNVAHVLLYVCSNELTFSFCDSKLTTMTLSLGFFLKFVFVLSDT